jgi:hypothetical protein
VRSRERGEEAYRSISYMRESYGGVVGHSGNLQNIEGAESGILERLRIKRVEVKDDQYARRYSIYFPPFHECR